MGQLDQLTIPNVRPKTKIQKEQHENIIKHVENLLKLNNQQLDSNSQSQTISIKRKINFFTDEID
jgi:hypothetical protein